MPPRVDHGFDIDTETDSETGSRAGDTVAALDLLVPAARLPARARLRVGVGAAIVLLLAALVVAVVVSVVGQQSASRLIPANSAGPPGAAAAESTPSGGTTADDPANPGGTGGAASVSGIIFVHVLGAVARPGLFELSEGARVIDAVAAAGGMTEAADPAGTNLARRLTDGEQLYLPQTGEIPAGVPAEASAGAAGASSPGGTGDQAGTVVNLNAATLADLDTLPRIGPAMAQRILDYRDTNGPFTSTDELRNITGIGDKTFEALKDLVTV